MVTNPSATPIDAANNARCSNAFTPSFRRLVGCALLASLDVARNDLRLIILSLNKRKTERTPCIAHIQPGSSIAECFEVRDSQLSLAITGHLCSASDKREMLFQELRMIIAAG